MNNGKFKKGNQGKPKGALNKKTKLIKEVFAEVFDEMQNDPKANLLAWGKLYPTDFYRLAIRLIPTQVAIDNDKIDLRGLPIVFD